jgi:hypothetical protein
MEHFSGQNKENISLIKPVPNRFATNCSQNRLASLLLCSMPETIPELLEDGNWKFARN